LLIRYLRLRWKVQLFTRLGEFSRHMRRCARFRSGRRLLRWRDVLNISLAITAIYFFCGWFGPPPVTDAGEMPSARLVSVYRHDIGQVVTMDIEEYIKGVVAAEMPASFSLEALKAQAVASRTYTIYSILKGTGVPGVAEAAVSTHYGTSQAWISEEALRRRYGFLEYYWRWRKISQAVEETRGLIMTYQNEPILAVYHSDSGGRTENSENYWSSPLPYLRSVDDPYSKQPPVVDVRDVSEVLAKVQRIPNRIKVTSTGGGRSGEAAAAASGTVAADPLVEVIERYRSGRVKSVRVNDTIVTGRALREALGLRSNWFDVSVTGSKIRFVQYGYGHGVGMPQYGADGMAKMGYGFEEILKYYYRGVELTKWYD